MSTQFSSLLAAATLLFLPTLGIAANTASASLNEVLNARAERSTSPGVSEVRAQALRSIGRSLGMRAGLSDGSKGILEEIEKNRAELDKRFHFGALMFSTGALPPVIEETKDVMSVMDYSFRIAGQVYRIVAPARFAQINWRDYLYIGLATINDPLLNANQRSVYPRDSAESEFWKQVVQEGYAEGVKQARETFNVNLARLERDFNGMRLYYELAHRGLVSAPVIAGVTESVTRPDPNTLVIGETMIRITQQPAFEADDDKWRVRQ